MLLVKSKSKHMTENIVLPQVWIHTNIPAPYRRHLFEMISRDFAKCRVFFYDKMHSDRSMWNSNTHDWEVCHGKTGFQVRAPIIGKISLQLIPQLLIQPTGTIHLVGSANGNWWLILLSCFIRKSIFVDWNDAGFPKSVNKYTAQIKKKLRYLVKSACFSPGKLGREYCAALGYRQKSIFNAYFSHDVEYYKKYYLNKASGKYKHGRTSLGISMASFVILTISRYIDLKRLCDAATALALLDEDPDLKDKELVFVLVGEGESLVHEEILLSLKRIRFIKINKIDYDDIIDIYAIADLFLFPSEGDIWGLVINEALSMGVPVICTNAIGASELVQDSINGIKVSTRSPNQIAYEIKRILLNPPLMKAMKQSALSIWTDWNSELGIDELKRLAKKYAYR